MIRITKTTAGAAKQLTALLLALVLSTGFLPVSAFAEGNGTSAGDSSISTSAVGNSNTSEGDNTSEPAPGASDMAPGASDMAPGASDMAPGASDMAPGASDMAPEINGMLRTMAPPVGLPPVDSYWPSFRGNDTNMAITHAPLPIDNTNINLKWQKRLGEGWSASPSNQIIVGDSLVVMGGKNIFKLDIKTGAIVASSAMVQTPGFSVVSPTYGAGMIFCPLGSGTVQAFNAETLEPLWVYTDPLGGQSLSPIVYSDGYVYTGFWQSEVGDANFVAIPITDEDPKTTGEAKSAAWTVTNKGGFYWAGAVAIGDAIIFGTDDGVNNANAGDGAPSKVYSLNKYTGKIISELDIIGDQRSTIAYDRDSRKIYFTTKHSYLYSAVVDADSGELSELVENRLESNMQSTSTPVVYKGRVYIGGGKGFNVGSFVAADADTLAQLYSIPLKGYPQCSMLMTTAYEEDSGYIYLYSTYNNNPGGITMIKLKPDATTADDAELIELYDAKGVSGYCIASLICGPDGTIYYKNDSGNVLAVGVPQATGVVNLIAAIGKVTLTSADAITIARNAYDALPDDDKAAVTNYTLLTTAEATLAQLILQKKLDNVNTLIANIGTVTKHSGSAIRAARSAYNALTYTERAQVKSYSTLTAAERRYDQLTSSGSADKPPVSNPSAPVVLPPYTAPQSLEVMDRITTLPIAGVNMVEQIAEAYKLYIQLTDAQKSEILNFEALETQMTAVGKQNHVDSISGIKVDGADWNIKLNVQPTGSTDQRYSVLTETLGSNTLLMAWDISLWDILKGGQHTPDGELTLRMPAPDLDNYDDIVIAHFMDSGEVEYIDCEIASGEISWQVTGFSYYAVVRKAQAATTPLPQAGELPTAPTPILPELPLQSTAQSPTLPWLWIILAIAGMLAVAVALLARNGKIFAQPRSSDEWH